MTPPKKPALTPDTVALLRALVSSVSHHLGSPLNVITGRAELISLDASDPQAVVEHVEILRRQTQRITSALTQLGHMLEPESVSPAPGPLSQLLDELSLDASDALRARTLRSYDAARLALRLLLWTGDATLNVSAHDATRVKWTLTTAGSPPAARLADLAQPWFASDGEAPLELGLALQLARRSGADAQLDTDAESWSLVLLWPANEAPGTEHA